MGCCKVEVLLGRGRDEIPAASQFARCYREICGNDGMKRVLIVGADFTPSSHPPALRIRFFAQHLREFGWEPIVLTVDPDYYETAIDAENGKLLRSDIEVIRTRALPARL